MDKFRRQHPVAMAHKTMAPPIIAEARRALPRREAPVAALAARAPLPVPAISTTHESADCLSLYMREVGEVGLLTPADEVRLAARIKRGDREARERMIRANLRLVVKIARTYEGQGVPLLDLINEGNLGLMRAVEKFDPAKGGKLSTYSSWWIKQAIRRAIATQAKTVRMPVHLHAKIAAARQAVTKLSGLFGQEPTDEELALEMGITAKKAAGLRSGGVRMSSMDVPFGDDGTGRVGDLIPDEQAESPCDQLEQKTMLNLLEEWVGRLPQRELRILRLRFGLDGGPPHSLEEIGRELGLTRERIRQLQNLALKKLRGMKEVTEGGDFPPEPPRWQGGPRGRV